MLCHELEARDGGKQEERWFPIALLAIYKNAVAGFQPVTPHG